MQDWQETYIRNVREVAEIRQLFSVEEPDFDVWYAEYRSREERLQVLKAENTALLSTHFFPLLDELHSASPETIADLEAFGDVLMDWKTNLDCGVYVAIHDALLSLCRVRRDRDGIIRELYKLGMGLYYLQRPLVGVYCRQADSMHFRNEMVFTEAGSYFRYFDRIENSDTRAYILRGWANISICTPDFKRRVDTSINFIRTVRSPEYRAKAPELPWDTYLSRAYQQLSSSRSQLNSDGITRTEIAAVMDACYEVFKPQAQSANPSPRWLWPYYDMEYHCGYVSLETTVERLENLIRAARWDEYDVAGLYANVQLPVFLGRLIRDHEQLREDPARIRFLDMAYRKMLKCLMTAPPEYYNENFFYTIVALVTDFYEHEAVISYREVTTRLMQRFAGRLYLSSLKAGELLACYCAYILKHRPDYFAKLPVLEGITDPEERRTALLRYAADCGLYHDFGLFKMNMKRIMQTRSLFENEDEMYRLHTISGHDDLRRRESTRQFADIAHGHHAAYSAAEADPSGYVRMDSPCRRMTDLMAIISDLMEHDREEIRTWAKRILSGDRGRFSPIAAAFLSDATLLDALDAILRSDDRARCREAFDYYYLHTQAAGS